MARVSRKDVNRVPEKTTITIKKFKTALYTRSSREKENSKETIESQVDILKNFVENKEELEIYKIYSDVGYTGTNFMRPKFKEMMADIKNGKVDCVIIKDLSRLGRNHLQTGEVIFNDLLSKNIRFISVNDNYDILGETQGTEKPIILFKNLMNDMYSKDLSKKIKTALEIKRKNGENVRSLPTYGYLFSEDRGLIIDKTASLVVKQIFNFRLNGKSEISIANYLNSNNVATPNEYFYSINLLNHDKYTKKMYWCYSTVLKILKNEAYIGSLVQGKISVENKKIINLPKDEWIIHKDKHEPIISKDIFNKVQVILENSRNKHNKENNNIKYSENKYKKKLKCKCGLGLKRHRDIGKTSIVYRYACQNCRQILKQNKFKFPMLKEVYVDKFTIEFLNKQFTIAKEIKKKIKLYAESKDYSLIMNNLINDRSLLEEEKETKYKIILTAYKDYNNNLLDEQEFQIVKLNLESNVETLNKEINKINEEINHHKLDFFIENKWLNLFDCSKNINKLNREIINKYIEKIVIDTKTNEINISCKFEDEFVTMKHNLDKRETKLC